MVSYSLNSIGKRISDNHNARFVYVENVVEKIVSICNDPDSEERGRYPLLVLVASVSFVAIHYRRQRLASIL